MVERRTPEREVETYFRRGVSLCKTLYGNTQEAVALSLHD